MTLRWLAIAALASITAAPQAHAACQAEGARHDRIEVRCSWPAGARGLHFEAHFAGSHDDTAASLIASLNDTPLACAAGSKTTLDGQEEGDATMSCRLTAVPVSTGTPTTLRFQLRWHHARYTGFDVRVEPGP